MRATKLLFSTFVLLASHAAWAATPAAPAASAGPAAAAPVQGEVLEVKDASSYTYLRLKSSNGESWAAVPKTALSVGAHVTINNPMVMSNFVSKTLNRSFPSIVFGTLAGSAAPVAAVAHGDGAPVSAGAGADEKIAKASGADARTVAEVISGGASLKDRTVLVRGKIVKYTPDVMGKNWLHLRDGSGNPADRSNDLVVTTNGVAKVGDTVTVKGLVHTEKTLGGGYYFKVLVEEATLLK